MIMGLVQSSSPAVCKSMIWFGKYLTTRLRENGVKHVFGFVYREMTSSPDVT